MLIDQLGVIGCDGTNVNGGTLMVYLNNKKKLVKSSVAVDGVSVVCERITFGASYKFS